MRLDVLNTGYRLRTKALLRVIEMVTRQPLPDAAKVNFYRPEFYGAAMRTITQEAMRGPSAWSVGERELMAAYVSMINRSRFCVAAHTATASMALDDEQLVAAALSNPVPDPGDSSLGEPLRATLALLGKLTRDHTVDAHDVRAVLDAGATRDQIQDALAVCFCFNIINRLADAFGFAQLSPQGFESGAKYLLARGYG